MYCPRCNDRVKMKPVNRKGGFHKQTKFNCPECGLNKMKRNKSQKRKKSKQIKFDYRR